MNNAIAVLKRFQKNSDLLVAVLAVLVVVMLVIPLPTFLLDILLTINISAALLILLTTTYAREPLDFSAFPSILLATTLFRLALNVSTTRLILLNGYAGEVVGAFGAFVVGGSVVVGLVVFFILVIIQFVVITNGANRVAEVAARFTLDAMPGKQMAIDADLNAGLIDETEARARRQKLEKEADFYGSMDGASKFVKGDAIAGIIVVAVNLIGGFVVGMAVQGMSFEEALQTFSLLTVGDGLVTQIPALLIAVATGLMVTRAASDKDLGREVTGQILLYPRALFVGAVALTGFAVMPGLPTLPFLMMAAAFGVVAYSVTANRREREKRAQLPEPALPPPPEEPEDLLRLDRLELELGQGLVGLVGGGPSADLLERITAVRKQIASDMGYMLPPVRVRDNPQYVPTEYRVRVKGVEVAQGEVRPGQLLAILSEDMAPAGLEGVKVTEPVFGLPALWIEESARDQAELAGCTVVDPTSTLATHFSEVVRKHGHELLGRDDVKGLLDNLRQTNPASVDELVPNQLSLAEVHRTLQNLLVEGIPIRDLVTILEVLGDKARLVKDTDLLTEFVRQSLARTITIRHRHEDESIHVLTLEPEIEQSIVDSVKHTEYGSYVVLEPSFAQRILESLKAEAEKMANLGYEPILLCSAVARPHVGRFFRQFVPVLTVLSHNEIIPGQKIHSKGVVGASEA